MIAYSHVGKSFAGRGNERVKAVDDVSLEVAEGEFLAIVGASGSGKSTLLHLLGTIDRPDDGEIRLSGERIDNLPGERRDQLRNQTFGFIFQFYHLLPELNTLENVLIPQMIAHSLVSAIEQGRSLACAMGARLLAGFYGPRSCRTLVSAGRITWSSRLAESSARPS